MPALAQAYGVSAISTAGTVSKNSTAGNTFLASAGTATSTSSASQDRTTSGASPSPNSSSSSELGPFGAHNPRATFDDAEFSNGGVNPIRRIEYQSGALLNGLQVTYGSSDKAPWRGSSGGETKLALELAEDEYITQALVHSNTTAVCALTLFTNKRDEPVFFGSAKNVRRVDPATPTEGGPYRLVALKGSADSCIGSLTFVWGLAPVPGMEVVVRPDNFEVLDELMLDAVRHMTVFKARCVATGQLVAVKELRLRERNTQVRVTW